MISDYSFLLISNSKKGPLVYKGLENLCFHIFILGVKNFLVLEAKDYIGGRLREEVWHGKTIAIGAGKSKSKRDFLCQQ